MLNTNQLVSQSERISQVGDIHVMGMLIDAGSIGEKNLSVLFGGSDIVRDSFAANATNILLLRNYMASEIR